MSPCHICNMPCRDWKDSEFINCCAQCSYAVMAAAGEPAEFADNGFPKTSPIFMSIIKELKENWDALNLPTKKKYINECPCGIHPNACEYHQ